MRYRNRIIAVICLAALAAVVIWSPYRVSEILQNLLALSNVAIFLFAMAVLGWFLYAVIFRRILRARRIANARMRRLLREAGNDKRS